MNTKVSRFRRPIMLVAIGLVSVGAAVGIAAQSQAGSTSLTTEGASQTEGSSPAEATEPATTTEASSTAAERPVEPPAVTEIPGIGLDAQLDWQTYGGETALRERIIEVCMGQAGFEYTPTPLTEGPAGGGDQPPQGHPTDPNKEIYDSLSAEDQRAYSQALGGVDDVYDDRQISAAGQTGCVATALEILPGAANLNPALIDGLAAEISAHRTSDAECPDGLTPEEIDERYLLDDDPSNDGQADQLHAACERTTIVDIEAVQGYVDERAEEFAAHLEQLEADLVAAEEYIAG
jgi:hypothetical protein